MKTDRNIIEDFFKKYPTMKFQKGERVIRPGILNSSVVCITSGFVRLFIISKEAKDITICFLNVAKLQSLIMGGSNLFNKYSVEALTELEVIQVPREAFMEYINKNPEVFRRFAKNLFELANML